VTLTPEELRRQAYHAAVRLLSRRDHSSAELKKKLGAREYRGIRFEESSIDEAIERLTAEGFVDDARVAAYMAQQRFASGYGPRAIRAKLMQRGFSNNNINDALETLALEVGPDWVSHAESVLTKRFSAEDIDCCDAKTEGRIARFLQSRGFSTSDALRALQSARSNSVS